MVKDAQGREGLSAGAMAKELAVSPAAVKKALGQLDIEADFVKAGCAYYYHPERTQQVKAKLQ